MLPYKVISFATALIAVRCQETTANDQDRRHQGHTWHQVSASLYDKRYIKQVGTSVSLNADSISKCITLSSTLPQWETFDSVRFDQQSKLCTPSTWLVYQSAPVLNDATAPLVSYYYKTGLICDETENSHLIHPTSEETGLCVYVSDNTMHYDEAEAECTEKHAGLLYRMKTPDKHEALRTLVSSLGTSYTLWMGMKDVYDNLTFYWSDGEMYEGGWGVFPWDNDQPNFNGQRCVCTYSSNALLHDIRCTYHNYQYVCEKRFNVPLN